MASIREFREWCRENGGSVDEQADSMVCEIGNADEVSLDLPRSDVEIVTSTADGLQTNLKEISVAADSLNIDIGERDIQVEYDPE